VGSLRGLTHNPMPRKRVVRPNSWQSVLAGRLRRTLEHDRTIFVEYETYEGIGSVDILWGSTWLDKKSLEKLVRKTVKTFLVHKKDIYPGLKLRVIDMTKFKVPVDQFIIERPGDYRS
jgi:hypothetical protein